MLYNITTFFGGLLMYLHASNDLQCIKTSRSAKWWEHIEIRLKSQKETGTNSEVFYQRASRCHQKCSPSPRAIGIGHLCLKTSTLRDWRPPAIFRNGGWNLFSTAPVIHQVQFFPIDHQSLWFFRIRPPPTLDSKPLADLTHEIGVTHDWGSLIFFLMWDDLYKKMPLMKIYEVQRV